MKEQEDSAAQNNSPQTGSGAGQQRPGRRRWVFAALVKRGVFSSLAFSLAIFAVYLVGSIPDPGFPDPSLFLLMHILMYASLLLCTFSLLALSFSVYHLVYFPSAYSVFWLCFYFFTGILGAGLAMFNALIFATTGGYG